MTNDAKAREDAFGKEWGFRSVTRSYAERVQAEYWFDAGWRSALEAASASPAVDREALAKVLTHEENYVHDADGDGWVWDMPTAVARLFASGILRDVRDVQAETLEQAAGAMPHMSGENLHSRWLRARAQAIREARND